MNVSAAYAQSVAICGWALTFVTVKIVVRAARPRLEVDLEVRQQQRCGGCDADVAGVVVAGLGLRGDERCGHEEHERSRASIHGLPFLPV